MIVSGLRNCNDRRRPISCRFERDLSGNAEQNRRRDPGIIAYLPPERAGHHGRYESGSRTADGWLSLPLLM
jgi:hypothetical protein